MSDLFLAPQGAPQATYYEILQTSPTSLDSQKHPAQALKKAYHRALLIHHPDKRKQPTRAPPTPSITIDQISLAYAVLSSPSRRAEYDRLLLLSTQRSSSTSGKQPVDSLFQTGIENADLDDLAFDAERGEWYRGCRCGNPRAYRFAEPDLEEAADYGEVMVGCQDCSLWLRVHFAVVEDDDDDDAEERSGDGGDGSGGEGRVAPGEEMGGTGGKAVKDAGEG